jgi:hypothetical protein
MQRIFAMIESLCVQAQSRAIVETYDLYLTTKRRLRFNIIGYREPLITGN